VASATVGASNFNTAQPDCPAGNIAVSGGTDVQNVLNMLVTANAPWFADRLLFQPDGAAPAPTGWYGAVLNNQASSAAMKVGAVCSDAIAASAQVASISVMNGDFAGAFAYCPMGTVAIGGGVDVNNVFTMRVTASAPVFPGNVELIFMADGEAPAPIGWAGFARNDGASPLPMKVAVICTSDVSPSAMIASTTANSGSFSGSNVSCPLGTNAIGGGIDLGNVLTMTVTSTAPLFPGMVPDSFLLSQLDGAGPAPVGWAGYARNDDPSGKLVKVAAICVPEPSAEATSISIGLALGGLVARRQRRFRIRIASRTRS